MDSNLASLQCQDCQIQVLDAENIRRLCAHLWDYSWLLQMGCLLLYAVCPELVPLSILLRRSLLQAFTELLSSLSLSSWLSLVFSYLVNVVWYNYTLSTSSNVVVISNPFVIWHLGWWCSFTPRLFGVALVYGHPNPVILSPASISTCQSSPTPSQ